MNSYNYAQNNPIVNKDPNGHGLIGELGEIGLRMVEARNAPYTVLGNYYSTFGNPNVPISQHIGAAIDGFGIPAALVLVPSLAPVAGVYGMYEAFVFSGEVITGRDPSESGEYVQGLKERAASGWKIPGYNFAPSPKPSSSGSSNGPMPGTSGSYGGNGQPQPQKTPSGGSGGGGSSQSYYQQQMASIQAQIASIQAQINAYVQSDNQKR